MEATKIGKAKTILQEREDESGDESIGIMSPISIAIKIPKLTDDWNREQIPPLISFGEISLTTMKENNYNYNELELQTQKVQ